MLAQQGEAPPAPELPEHLLWAWRAWHRLSQDRPWRGGGLGPPFPGGIAWRDVRAWCEFYDLPGGAVETLDKLIREMDAEFFAWHSARVRQP